MIAVESEEITVAVPEEIIVQSESSDILKLILILIHPTLNIIQYSCSASNLNKVSLNFFPSCLLLLPWKIPGARSGVDISVFDRGLY